MIIPTTLQVLFLAAEADPLVKIGGLGDVAGSLPLALRDLRERKVDIRLVIPFHGSVQHYQDDFHKVADFILPHRDGPIPVQTYITHINSLPVYLISGSPIPPESPVYSGSIQFDTYKYLFFSLAALQLTQNIKFQPHILHVNDWHTAAAAYALAVQHPSVQFLKSTAALLEVHNLPYLGETTGQILDGFGLPPADNFRLPPWAEHMILPMGLLTADHIVTVSPTYAQEILTPEFGSGLHDFLRTREDSISGILNGIDTERWNPKTDLHITENYSTDQIAKRAVNKPRLQKELELKIDPDIPLVGMITRMDFQKGVDLAIEALQSIRDLPWQAVVLGTGNPILEGALNQLQTELPGKVRAIIRFDPGLSRRIYSGADALLMPSRYEPCGIAQMIAMRYGCVPIARAIGGLIDTINDDPAIIDSTGFLFTHQSGEALANTLRRAFEVYEQPEVWRQIQYNGMLQDFSWERSAREYLELYDSIIIKKSEQIEDCPSA